MSLLSLILLSIALGIDCFVVSFSQGLIVDNNRFKNAFILAFTMGMFQFLMPFIGYYLSDIVLYQIVKYAPIIVFAIFFFLGIKLIIEAFKEYDENEKIDIGFISLISMGFATSIDAMASGITLNLSDSPLIYSALIIGLGSFILSVSGFFVTNFIKQLPSKYLEIFGGLLLILLAVKSLF